jgi:hypothetical protein
MEEFLQHGVLEDMFKPVRYSFYGTSFAGSILPEPELFSGCKPLLWYAFFARTARDALRIRMDHVYNSPTNVYARVCSCRQFWASKCRGL